MEERETEQATQPAEALPPPEPQPSGRDDIVAERRRGRPPAPPKRFRLKRELGALLGGDGRPRERRLPYNQDRTTWSRLWSSRASNKRKRLSAQAPAKSRPAPPRGGDTNSGGYSRVMMLETDPASAPSPAPSPSSAPSPSPSPGPGTDTWCTDCQRHGVPRRRHDDCPFRGCHDCWTCRPGSASRVILRQHGITALCAVALERVAAGPPTTPTTPIWKPPRKMVVPPTRLDRLWEEVQAIQREIDALRPRSRPVRSDADSSPKQTTPAKKARKSVTPTKMPRQETTPAKIPRQETTPAKMPRKDVTPTKMPLQETTPAKIPQQETTPAKMPRKDVTPTRMPRLHDKMLERAPLIPAAQDVNCDMETLSDCAVRLALNLLSSPRQDDDVAAEKSRILGPVRLRRRTAGRDHPYVAWVCVPRSSAWKGGVGKGGMVRRVFSVLKSRNGIHRVFAPDADLPDDVVSEKDFDPLLDPPVSRPYTRMLASEKDSLATRMAVFDLPEENDVGTPLRPKRCRRCAAHSRGLAVSRHSQACCPHRNCRCERCLTSTPLRASGHPGRKSSVDQYPTVVPSTPSSHSVRSFIDPEAIPRAPRITIRIPTSSVAAVAPSPVGDAASVAISRTAVSAVDPAVGTAPTSALSAVDAAVGTASTSAIAAVDAAVGTFPTAVVSAVDAAVGTNQTSALSAADAAVCTSPKSAISAVEAAVCTSPTSAIAPVDAAVGTMPPNAISAVDAAVCTMPPNAISAVVTSPAGDATVVCAAPDSLTTPVLKASKAAAEPELSKAPSLTKSITHLGQSPPAATHAAVSSSSQPQSDQPSAAAHTYSVVATNQHAEESHDTAASRTPSETSIEDDRDPGDASLRSVQVSQAFSICDVELAADLDDDDDESSLLCPLSPSDSLDSTTAPRSCSDVAVAAPNPIDAVSASSSSSDAGSASDPVPSSSSVFESSPSESSEAVRYSEAVEEEAGTSSALTGCMVTFMCEEDAMTVSTVETFECVWCGRQFLSEDAVSVHALKHAGDDDAEEEEKGEEEVGDDFSLKEEVVDLDDGETNLQSSSALLTTDWCVSDTSSDSEAPPTVSSSDSTWWIKVEDACDEDASDSTSVESCDKSESPDFVSPSKTSVHFNSQSVPVTPEKSTLAEAAMLKSSPPDPKQSPPGTLSRPVFCVVPKQSWSPENPEKTGYASSIKSSQLTTKKTTLSGAPQTKSNPVRSPEKAVTSLKPTSHETTLSQIPAPLSNPAPTPAETIVQTAAATSVSAPAHRDEPPSAVPTPTAATSTSTTPAHRTLAKGWKARRCLPAILRRGASSRRAARKNSPMLLKLVLQKNFSELTQQQSVIVDRSAVTVDKTAAFQHPSVEKRSPARKRPVHTVTSPQPVVPDHHPVNADHQPVDADHRLPRVVRVQLRARPVASTSTQDQQMVSGPERRLQAAKELCGPRVPSRSQMVSPVASTRPPTPLPLERTAPAAKKRRFSQADNTEKSPFSCGECPSASFPSRVALACHRLSRHASETWHRCPRCKDTFHSAQRRDAHVAMAHALPRYACPLCPERVPTRFLLDAHGHIAHGRPGLLDCPLCPAEGMTEEELSAHFSGDHRNRRPLQCYACDATTQKVREMLSHVSKHVARLRRLHCGTCGAWYPTNELVQAHQADAHGTTGFTAAVPASPENDDSRASSCRCGKSFPGPEELLRHSVSSLHSAELPNIECPKCFILTTDRLHVREHEESLMGLVPLDRVVQLLALLDDVKVPQYQRSEVEAALAIM